MYSLEWLVVLAETGLNLERANHPTKVWLDSVEVTHVFVFLFHFSQRPEHV